MGFDSGIGRLVRLYGTVSAFRLDVTLTVRSRPVRVEVNVPRHLTFDRRHGSEVIREHLLQAGFMSLPEALREAS